MFLGIKVLSEEEEFIRRECFRFGGYICEGLEL